MQQLNSGIFIFGKYYLNLPISNQQKATRINSSCCFKMPPSTFIFKNLKIKRKLSGQKHNDLFIFTNPDVIG